MSALAEKAYKGIAMDGVAVGYPTASRTDLAEVQTLARRVTREAPAGGRILEVAPGSGHLAVEMAKEGSSGIYALDANRASVETARRNVEREGVAVRVRQGDYAAMPFPDERFDYVVCRAALNSFARPLETLREMERVLKPGGKALIVDSPDGGSMSLASRWFAKLTRGTALLHRTSTAERFQQLVAHSGFSKWNVVENEIGFEAILEKADDGADEHPASASRRMER